MTDDLVKQLRDGWTEDGVSNGFDEDVLLIAADHIEELEKRVKQAKIVFATMRSEMSSVVMEAFEND